VHRLGRQNQPAAYVLAVMLPLAAVLLRVALTPLLGDGAAYLFLFPALTVVGWLGGMGPGVVATACGAVASTVLLREQAMRSGAQLVLTTAVFFVAGAFISYLCHLLHRESRRANREARRLTDALAQREQMEQQLRDNEQRLRGILDNVGALI
jgi:K+-sensing histidine kinase KdpD